MRTLASVLPPGPLAVTAYVVDSAGVTVVVPCGVAAPTSGLMEMLVASVVVQVSLADSPLLIVVRSAEMLTVGLAATGAGAGGGGGGRGCFLWQPTMNRRTAEAKMRSGRSNGECGGFIRVLLRHQKKRLSSVSHRKEKYYH